MNTMEEPITRLFNMSAWIIPILIVAAIVLPQALRILREYERGVIFRLGKLIPQGAKGPGLIFLIPVVDRMVKMDLRVVTIDVPKQEVMTLRQCAGHGGCRRLFPRRGPGRGGG